MIIYAAYSASSAHRRRRRGGHRIGRQLLDPAHGDRQWRPVRRRPCCVRVLRFDYAICAVRRRTPTLMPPHTHTHTHGQDLGYANVIVPRVSNAAQVCGIWRRLLFFFCWDTHAVSSVTGMHCGQTLRRRRSSRDPSIDRSVPVACVCVLEQVFFGGGLNGGLFMDYCLTET